ncbi:MAG: hypothetical protein CL609_15080 [Anaerolineaceae bacterium]|nr:hypothetical protein [Anaerolineaceae bacterium]
MELESKTSINENSIDVETLFEEFSDVNMYQNNLYLAFQLHPMATNREIHRRYQQITVAKNIGAEIPVGKMQWSGFQSKNETAQELLDIFEKSKRPEFLLLQKFFWFWPEGDNDIFLDKFSDGDHETIKNLWVQQKKNNNFTAIHNLAIYYHLIVLDRCLKLEAMDHNQMKQIIQLWHLIYDTWGTMIEREEIWLEVNRSIREIDDVRLKTGFSRKIRNNLVKILFLSQARCYLNAIEQKRFEFARELFQSMQWHAHQFPQGWEVIRNMLNLQKERFSLVIQQTYGFSNKNGAEGLKYLKELLRNSQWFFDINPLAATEIKEITNEIDKDLFYLSKYCIQAYDNATERWDVIVNVLDKLKKFFPEWEEEIANYKTEFEERLATNHHFLTSYHQELPPEVKKVIENASKLVNETEFEQSQTVLREFFQKTQHTLFRHEVKAIYTALAFSLNHLASRTFNILTEKMKNPTDQILNVLRNYENNEEYFEALLKAARNGEIDYVKEAGYLYCQSCGDSLGAYDDHVVVEEKDILVIFCVFCFNRHQNQLIREKREIKEVVRHCFSLSKEAYLLNPMSITIKNNLDFITKEASFWSITVPNPAIKKLNLFPEEERLKKSDQPPIVSTERLSGEKKYEIDKNTGITVEKPVIKKDPEKPKVDPIKTVQEIAKPSTENQKKPQSDNKKIWAFPSAIWLIGLGVLICLFSIIAALAIR